MSLELQFDHIGIPVDSPQAEEFWVPASECWVTNPRTHPQRIEYLRFKTKPQLDPGSPQWKLWNMPHIEFKGHNMSRLSTVVCFVAVLAAGAISTPAADRSSIVIGKSLSANAKPKPGKLNSPFGVDFDAAGNMYIVELEGGRVHKLTTGGRFTTIAGDGSKGYAGDGGPSAKATFNGMHNLAVTPRGDVFISDAWNHCVRKIDGKTGFVSTIAGNGQAGFSGDGGPATKATFSYVMCVSLNPANDKLYVADLRNRRIRVIDLKDGTVSTVAGNGKRGVPRDGAVAIDSPLVDPRAVAVDSKNNVYILERSGNALRVVSPDGKIKTVAGTGKAGIATGPALKAQLRSPKHITIDHSDNVLIADERNQRILKYDPRKQTVTALLGAGVDNPKRKLSKPHGVCVHTDGAIYVVDTGHHRILRLQSR